MFRFPASTFDLLGDENCVQIHMGARITEYELTPEDQDVP